MTRRRRKLLLLLLLPVSLSMPAAPWAFASSAPPPTSMAAQPAEPWDVTRPRGRTREIDFTTTEGTKMSVDVSRDGRFVVFDLLAHIYRVPISGGTAECLTQESGIALNYAPRFSPDGREIAFVSDRGGQNNVWIMGADGSNPRPLFNDPDACAEEPVWTADGRYLIVRRQLICHRGSYYSTLWMYHRDGGGGVRLSPETGLSRPSVSPDGRFLYHQAGTCAGHFGEATTGCLQIRRLDLRDGIVHELFESPGEGGFSPAISPDGASLAFARRVPGGTLSRRGRRFGPRAALWIRDLESGGERMVMDPVDADMAEQPRFSVRALPAYAWTPDGASIVLSQGGRLRRLDVRSGTVATIPFTARVRRTLSEMAHTPFRVGDGPFEARMIRWATASPDGRRIVFHAVGRIWLADAAGGAPKRLTRLPSVVEMSPAWSPDGRTLAFTTWNATDGGNVWTIPAGGGKPRPLTESAGEYLNPAWSADGRSLVVMRGSGSTARRRSWPDNLWYDLVRLPAGGGRPVALARVKAPIDPVQVPQPSVGRDGRIFYFEQVLPDGGHFWDTVTDVVSIDPDGGERRVHLRFPFAAEAAVSPGGEWAAFQDELNLFVVPLPRFGSGASPVVVERRDPALPVRRVSGEGGLFPRWRDDDRLEYVSGARHFTYSVASGTTVSAPIRLLVPRDLPRGRIALTGARLITMGDGVIERGTVVVENNRIACVGECDPRADRVVDLGGKTVVPGLIDMHAHANDRKAIVVDPRHYEAAVYLAYGITTTLDPSASSVTVFSNAELVRAGLAIGPRMFSTGEAIGSSLAGTDPDEVSDADLAAESSREIATLGDAQREVNRLASWGAVSIKQYMNRRRDQRQWIVEAARRRGVMVTGEAGTLEHQLGMIMDGQPGWEHEILALPIYADVAKFMGQAGATYSATFSAAGPGPWGDEYFYAERELWNDPKLRRFLPSWYLMSRTRRRVLRPRTDYGSALYAQALADIIAEGGYGAVGGHGQFIGLDTHFDIWMAAEGLGPLGALRAATIHPARFLGAEQDLGSLTPGKIADLVVLNSNPLDDIRNTTDALYVMQDGVLYDAATLDEIWPRQRRFGPYYWVSPEALQSDDRPDDYWDDPRR